MLTLQRAASLETWLNARRGFAARCEAAALPRRQLQLTLGLRPWCGLCPFIVAIRNVC
jgi:hypothetical protein